MRARSTHNDTSPKKSNTITQTTAIFFDSLNLWCWIYKFYYENLMCAYVRSNSVVKFVATNAVGMFSLSLLLWFVFLFLCVLFIRFYLIYGARKCLFHYDFICFFSLSSLSCYALYSKHGGDVSMKHSNVCMFSVMWTA